MNKLKREAVEEMLTNFEAHELIGSRRDVYEFVVSVLKDWLAQEEELECKDKLIKMQDGFITDKSKLAAERSTQISQLEIELDQLKAENQALNEEVGAIIQAIKDEPELPGPMPNEMLNYIEKAGIEETMRIVVRETKSGILRRTNHD